MVGKLAANLLVKWQVITLGLLLPASKRKLGNVEMHDTGITTNTECRGGGQTRHTR